MDKIIDDFNFNCKEAQHVLRLRALGEKVDPVLMGRIEAHIIFCKECRNIYMSLQDEIGKIKDLYNPNEIGCEKFMKHIHAYTFGVLAIINKELARKIEFHMLSCDKCAEAYGKLLDREVEKYDIKIPPPPDIDEYISKKKKEEERKEKRNNN